jgi:hypothetical protein
MKIKFFTFCPDGHYGYPEAIITDHPQFPDTIDSCADYFSQAGYSHDSDDIDGVDAFYQWGNVDLYGNVFIINTDGTEEIDDIINNALDYIDVEYGHDFVQSDVYMNEIISNPSVKTISRIPIYSSSESLVLGDAENNVENTNEITTTSFFGDYIISIIKNKSIQDAGGIFYLTKKSGLDISNYLKSKITEKEYEELLIAAEGFGLMKDIGFDL